MMSLRGALVAVLVLGLCGGGSAWRASLRKAARSLLAAGPLCTALAGPAGAVSVETVDRCVQKTTPTGMQVKCERHGLPASRLFGCNAGEACVSTSAVKSPSKYASPWKVPAGQDVFPRIVEEMQRAGVRIVEQDGSSGLRQYAYGTASAGPGKGLDDVEVLVVRDAPGGDGFVFFRSCSRVTESIYPFQQPLSDQGAASRERMDGIRRKLDLTKVQDDAFDASMLGARPGVPYV